MVSKLYKAKVPGSLMLFGEHAVLYGSPAIVSAVNYYITANLIPRSDQIINITSALLGNYKIDIKQFTIERPWQLVLTAIAAKLDKLSTGFDLIIESNFSDQMGLGSSAAVTVAIIAVLSQWLNDDLDKLTLVKIGRDIIQKVQGMGSGADIAASVFGGTIFYEMSPLIIEPLEHNPPLVTIYSGSKVSTVEVIKKVTSKRVSHEEVFVKIFDVIAVIVKQAVDVINNKNWVLLGELMDIHQGLQDAMGVSNNILSELIFTLRQQDTIYGAKISGSGLGDCVIGLGTLPDNYFPCSITQKQLGVIQIKV